MVKDYRNGRYNPLRFKGKSVKIGDITPKEKEYVFHEIDTTISDEEKVLGEVIRRLHNYDEKIVYLYIVKYNENGKHKIIRRIKIDENFYDRP